MAYQAGTGSSITLRPYQERFVAAIRAAYDAGHDSVMAVASTGAGKTICFSYIAENAVKIANTTFIVVHRKELVKQASKSLRENGIDHGVIAAGHKMKNAPIQVCSLQTLVGRLKLFNRPDLVVFDEAHHCTSKTYRKIIAWQREKTDSFILGVTATPIRSDGEGFTDIFDVMVEADDITQLFKDGWLVEPTYWAPKIEDVDLTKLVYNKKTGEPTEASMDLVMDKPKIWGSALAHYKKILPHFPPTVVFCTSVKNAQHVADEFTAGGVPSKSIDGSMDDDERAQIIKELETGVIKCLMSCDLVSEGFDLPAMSCAIMLRPIGDKCVSLYLQMLGRVLRPAPGKTEAVILDHVKNWEKHGFAHCDRHGLKRNWHDGFLGIQKEDKEKAGALTTCIKCYAVFPKAPSCPKCGVLQAEVRDRQGPGREVEVIAGELEKIDPGSVLTFKQTGATGRGRKTVIEKLVRVRN